MLTTDEKQELKSNQERGVKFLDEKHPGWADSIDTNNLDFNNPEKCIAGQIPVGELSLYLILNYNQRISYDAYWDMYEDADEVEDYLTSLWLQSVISRKSLTQTNN